MLVHCELERLGFDHTDVGGELLKRWNLPPHICASVINHHTPQRAGAHKQAAAVIHVADVLVNGIACGSSGERYVPPLDPAAWEQLGLAPSIVGPTLKLLGQQLNDTLAMLLDDNA